MAEIANYDPTMVKMDNIGHKWTEIASKLPKKASKQTSTMAIKTKFDPGSRTCFPDNDLFGNFGDNLQTLAKSQNTTKYLTKCIAL